MKILRYYLLFVLLIASTSRAQTWNSQASFPSSGRDGAIEFSIGTKIYFGGSDKQFWEYNTETNTWTRKADIPGVSTGRWFATGFSIGDFGYVGMGVDNSNPKDDFWQYDPKQNTWTQKATYPGGKRGGMLFFSVDGEGYVGGGSDNQYLYPEFYSYDPVTDTWTQLDPLPMGPVTFPSAFVIGNKAYVTGGDLGTANSELADLYEFDPSTATWTTRSPFIGAARQTAVGFALNGKGYIGLGQSGYTTLYNDLYSYDPVTDNWQKLDADFPVAPGRAWASATTVGTKAYIGGGWDFASTFYHDWWQFDPSATASVPAVVEATNGPVVFPNPSSATFEIRHPAAQSFSVIDALGRTVYSATVQEGQRYDISKLPSGSYLLRMGDRSVNIVKQ